MNQTLLAGESEAALAGSGKAWLLGLVVPTSLAAGFADTGIALFTARSGFASPGLAVVAAGAASVAVLLIAAPAFLLIGPLVRRASRFSDAAIAFSLCSFFLISVVLLSIGDRLSALVHRAPAGEGRLELVLLLGLALAGSAAIAFIVEYLDPAPGSLAKLVCAVWALPLLLSETMVATWVWRVALAGALSRPGRIAVGAVLAAVVLASAIAMYRFLPRAAARPARAAGLMAGSAVLLPASLSAFGALSHRQQQSTAVGESQIERVVLIVVDTLRADALSIYGAAGSTENVALLARDGVVFERAYSPASWTVPSVSSLMTGLLPAVHGAVRRDSRLPGDVTTLAEHLAGAGYVTGAVGDNTFLRSPSGLAQGFSQYRFFPGSNSGDLGSNLLAARFGSWGRRFSPWIESAELTALATDWIDAHADRDFFLWLHYFDPHLPYAPPTRFLDQDVPDGPFGREFSQLGEIRGGYLVPTLDERERIRELYRAEVSYVDEQIGIVLRFLKDRDLYEDSLIILTSDHGEELWEHGGFEHGHALWNELLHVPLVIKLPRSSFVGSYRHSVSTVALMPTILELCGIGFDGDLLSADSLVPALQGDSEPRRRRPISAISSLYFEEQSAILFDEWKYTISAVTGKEALYDLSSDPGELSSLVSREIPTLGRARRLAAEEKRLANELRARLGLASPTERLPLEPEELKRLKSLGYIE